MKTWLIHWSTAVLVVFMLLSSLPFLELSALWPSRHGWLTVHMAVGWLIILLTAARLVNLLFLRWSRPPHLLVPGGIRGVVKVMLLVSLILVLAAGAVIYRPSPLGAKVYLFGLEQTGKLLNFSLGIHLRLISWHLYLSYLSAAALVVHSCLPLARSHSSVALPIAWLWRRR